MYTRLYSVFTYELSGFGFSLSSKGLYVYLFIFIFSMFEEEEEEEEELEEAGSGALMSCFQRLLITVPMVQQQEPLQIKCE